jgi:hypothetical protein
MLVANRASTEVIDVFIDHSRNLCQLKTPCHRCEALRACDAHLMGIKCTCEGGIHRFTMYLKRIRKRKMCVEAA